MSFSAVWRNAIQRILPSLMSWLPANQRAGVMRRMTTCKEPPANLVLKIAETQEELEACFSLLHDAYVESGFMTPHPSGMRVTPYHALPTTTTLCAKLGDRVVATLSLIRDNPHGLPMQRIFDLAPVRAQGGQICEASALAVHARYRRTSGRILFPLLKYMYDYCTQHFDTQHLVIAVNPRHIAMYESVLGFTRLNALPVANYDFVNGAPAIGATLNLVTAPRFMQATYGRKPPARNLYRYFVEQSLPNCQFPSRTTGLDHDPVMTEELLSHFYGVKQIAQVFAR